MKSYLSIGIGVLLFFALILLFVLEFNYFNRYLDMGGFVSTALLVGFGLGLLLVGILGMTKKLGTKKMDRWRMALLVIMLCIVPMPLIMSLSNRLLDKETRESVNIEFVEEEARYGSLGMLKGEKVRPNAYHLIFYLDDRLYRIISPSPQFPDAKEGDQLEIQIRKGFWGFRWIDLGIKTTTTI